MPELPEVETMVRGIRPRVIGHTIEDVQLCECSCKPILLEPGLSEIRNRALGHVVSSVDRRAKRVILTLDSGDAFCIEPRMTGLMLVQDPPDVSHLRFEWKLKRGRKRHSVWFWDRRGLGTIRLLSRDQQVSLLGDKLGPDALSLTPERLRDRLSATTRAVKVALLDQKLIAGIGNLYASEILHLAGIHPQTIASKLSQARIRRLHAATQEVLQQAILAEGSTLGDGTYRNALNQNGSYQNHHRVYAREGLLCPTCRRGTIKRIVQAQRSTFYCPRCQR